MAMVLPFGEKTTSAPTPVGSVDGSATLVPKAVPVHGYTDTNGDVLCTIAMVAPFGENVTFWPVPVGSVAGLAAFVPKAVPVHG